MLAVVSPHSDPTCVKYLLKYKADYSVIDPSTGNNILLFLLHLAADRCPNFEVVEYLFQNCNIDVFQRRYAVQFRR